MKTINPDSPQRFYILKECIAENTTLPPMGRTERVYLFVRDYIQQVGYAPTYRGIMRGLHIGSENTVVYHLDKLVACGAIKKVPDTARGITLPQ